MNLTVLDAAQAELEEAQAYYLQHATPRIAATFMTDAGPAPCQFRPADVRSLATDGRARSTGKTGRTLRRRPCTEVPLRRPDRRRPRLPAAAMKHFVAGLRLEFVEPETLAGISPAREARTATYWQHKLVRCGHSTRRDQPAAVLGALDAGLTSPYAAVLEALSFPDTIWQLGWSGRGEPTSWSLGGLFQVHLHEFMRIVDRFLTTMPADSGCSLNS